MGIQGERDILDTRKASIKQIFYFLKRGHISNDRCRFQCRPSLSSPPLWSQEGLGRLGSPPLSPWSPSGEPPGQLELFVQCQKSDTSSLLKLSLSLRDVLTRAPPQEAHHRARRPTHSQTLTSFSQLFPLWQKPRDHRLGDLRDLDLVKNCTLGVQRLHFTWFLVLNCSISDLSI